jgi:hypothetical protein
MANNDFKLLEEKVEKMISFIQKLKKEREDLYTRLVAKEEETKQLKKGLAESTGSTPDRVAREEIIELIENLKEERTAIRDSLRGALRLITE